jgi:hypothetical protein
MGWHVSRDGAVSGPYTKAEVVKRIADGNINRDALVRKDPSVEWCPIEDSTFAAAFGASNPYNNPEPLAPKQSYWSGPFLWLAGATVLVLVVWLFAALSAESDPARSGRIVGEFVGRMVGALVLWGVIRSVWGVARPKTKRKQT